MKASWLLYITHIGCFYENSRVLRIQLLRQIHEYLLARKYFYKKQDEVLAEKWLDNRNFDV